ncbi:MAG: Na(+)-translocating NADH-quinone reductase subunit A [Bacteroidales bacterium]|nr:Na(+)-translocating NADH-quinone reductase subunit A [Bacteroidales bacterium]
MNRVIKLRKGLDIRIQGVAEKNPVSAPPSETYALKPIDFHGLTPKLMVRPDDMVQAGSPLFFDKYRPDILFTSPVSGRVKAVLRGERRKILEVVVEVDGKQNFLEYRKGDPLQMKRAEIVETLLKSGVWPFIRQRPFDFVANPADTPKAVFISLFDTSPLAPDYSVILQGKEKTFQTGINVLKQLTDGKVHLGVHPEKSDRNFVNALINTEIHPFSGPHPAGNVGVHIHYIDPLNKGELVWVVNPQDVLIIGRLFEEGRFDARRVVVLAGSEVKKTGYFETMMGASVEPMVKDNVKEGALRYISGNVLTGKKMGPSGYIGFYDSLISVIPEGNYFELLGWALPGFDKFSFSRTFFSWLRPGKTYRLDTNLHGGHRPFVLTGEYEKVMPMDILVMQLFKAILTDDIDMMENLGLYEVVEEDIALCEFIDPSKTEMQRILRDGINTLVKELG